MRNPLPAWDSLAYITEIHSGQIIVILRQQVSLVRVSPNWDHYVRQPCISVTWFIHAFTEGLGSCNRQTVSNPVFGLPKGSGSRWPGLGTSWRLSTRNELTRRHTPLSSHLTIDQPKLLHRYLARKCTKASERTTRYIWIKFRQGCGSIFVPFPLWSTM
jgi:hypothetical protein